MRELTCKEFIEFLDDYVGGAQTPELRAEFEAHLKTCPYCVDYVRTYREAIRIGKAVLTEGDDAVPDDVPADLVKAILDATKSREGRRAD